MDSDIYCDDFKDKCVKKVKVLNREYVYNPSMAGIFIATVCIFGGFTVGRLIDDFGAGWLDEYYPVDIWSIIHSIVCFGLMILFTILTQRKGLSFVISLLCSIAIEPIEYVLQSIYGIHSLGYEILANRFFDILFNTIGITIAYFVVDKFICVNQMKEPK